MLLRNASGTRTSSRLAWAVRKAEQTATRWAERNPAESEEAARWLIHTIRNLPVGNFIGFVDYEK